MAKQNQTRQMAAVLMISGLVLSAMLTSCTITGKATAEAAENTTTPDTQKQLKIGVILPLSGPVAVYGTESQKGIQLAIEEFNRKTGRNIEVIFEDDKSLDPTALIEAANKLANIDTVDIALTMVVEEAKPIYPLFKEQKIPLIVLWDDNQYIKEGGDYIFSTGFSTEKAGEMMADFAFKNLSLRRIAIIRHVDTWAEIISGSFKERFEELGGSIIYQEDLNVDQTDFKTTILKASQSEPDGVYFPMIPPANAQFLIQAEQLGMDITKMTGDAITKDVIEAAGTAAEGVYLTNGYADSPEDLTKKYRQRFGTDPIEVAIFASGYEGVKKIEPSLMSGSPMPIESGLIATFGPDRSMSKEEKIYRIEKGILVGLDEGLLK